MRWLWRLTDLTGAFQALFRLFMFIHIITTVLLTFTGSGAHAASLSSVTSKSRHRSKPRNTRNTQDGGDGGVTKESLGERECSEQEKQKQGCLAGSCAALVTSQLHTFIICRCPSNRQGARCEEIAINTDSIAEILMEQTKEELCKQERYDILAKSLGYERLFLDCVNKNYGIDVKDKQKRREKLKKEREKARRRKLRKRQRKREKKKSRSTEKSSFTTSHNIDTRDNLEQDIKTVENLMQTQKESRKRVKDHTGHNHKVRHEAEKSPSRRRRKSLTTFLVGTPTATPLTTTRITTNLATQRSRMLH